MSETPSTSLMNRKQRAAVVEAMERRILLSASLVKDIVPGPLSSQPHDAVSAGSSLYFFAADTATESGPTNTNLFITDGTAAGTVELRKIPQWVGNLQPVNDNGTLYYVEDNSGPVSDFRLWKSNGTSSGTVQVADLGSQLTAQLTVVGTTLYFVKGTEVWKTNPTSNSAVQAFVVPDQTIPPVLGTYAGRLLVDNFPSRLYTYDGTTLTPIGPAASETAHLENFLYGGEGRPGTDVLGGALYYLNAEHDPNAASQYIPTLYRADGSPSGVTVVKTFAPFESGEDYPVTGPWAAGGKLLFSLNNQLYASDGTSPGTVLLSSNLMLLNGAAVETLNGQAYFVTLDTSNYIESLWKTDGTPAGTVLVKDDIAGPNGASPALTVYHGRLYFTASSQEQVLWETDGTTAGTHPVNGITYPSAFTSQMRTSALGIANDTLYFTAPDPTVGNELFALTSPSQPLLIQGTGGNDTIAVSMGAANALVVNVNGTESDYTPAEYAGGISIDTQGAGTADTLTLAGLPGVDTTVTSSGLLKVTVGSAALGLADVASTSLTIGGSVGTAQVTVEDSADATARHLTLSTAPTGGVTYDVLHGLTPGDIRAAGSLLVVNLGNAGNTIDVGGTANVPPSFAIIDLNTGIGSDTVNISATGSNTVLNVNGQSGNDSVTVIGNPGVDAIRGPVNVSNPAGATALVVAGVGPHVLLDTFAAAGDTYGSIQQLSPAPINFSAKGVGSVLIQGVGSDLVVNNTPGGAPITFASLSTATILGVAAGQQLNVNAEEAGAGDITVDLSTGRVLGSVFAHGENVLHLIASPTQSFSDFPVTFDGDDLNGLVLTGGTYTFDRNLEFDLFGLPLTLDGTGTQMIAKVSQTLQDLSVTNGARLTLQPGVNLRARSIPAMDGVLDIGMNQAGFKAPSTQQLRNWIISGLAGGPGITSSAVDASHTIGYGNGGGAKWTYYGDANMDGSVGFDDLLMLAQSYGRTSANWYEGDFNYDGKVDFADLLKLAQNYGKSVPSTAAAAPVMGLQPSASEAFKLRKHRWQS